MRAVQVVIRDMPHSKALEDHIIKKSQKLAQHYERIQSCHIVVEMPEKHKHQGKLFNVRIDLTVPGAELVVNRKLDEDVYVAIRDAFAAIIRKLDTFACKRRGDVKSHAFPTHGTVSKIFPEEQYGFIQAKDGNEFYFNLTNVVYPSNEITIGDSVHFTTMASPDGMQAHHIIVEKKFTQLEDTE